MSDRPIRVLCVDDHAFLVEGLKARMSKEEDLEVVGWIPSADRLVEEVERTEAQVVLLDIEMQGADVFDALAELRRRCPQVRTIMLSAYVRDRYIDAAYEAGAWGYMCKSESPETVIEGIRSVVRGELAFSPMVLERSCSPTGRRSPDAGTSGSLINLLTARERQVLRMIAKGMSRTTIAEQLSRSPMTIDNHRKSIMKKLSIHERSELIRYAIAEGLVEV